ncbi:MAG TPA: hypothetical protein VNZ53_17615 [Steroidobacteraceae bacterium]|jgi:hypothetical protein|nr:hypothetical protein [Steroidobacteraceae bacterium]
MSENVVLIEKSFADAIAMIAAAEELPEEKRRHWMTSMRQVAKAWGRPLEVIRGQVPAAAPINIAPARIDANAVKVPVNWATFSVTGRHPPLT